jgi:hypothetical protein
MAKTWRQAIQKYGSLGAISCEKAFTSIAFLTQLVACLRDPAIYWINQCYYSKCYLALASTLDHN